MPSKKKEAPNKEETQQAEIPAIGRTEDDADKAFNTLLNKVDKAFMDESLDEVGGIIFAKSKFDEGDAVKAKTVLGYRRSDRNLMDASEMLVFMFMFACKKLGFKEDAAKDFIASQILEVNPEAKDVSAALDQLLSPNSP